MGAGVTLADPVTWLVKNNDNRIAFKVLPFSKLSDMSIGLNPIPVRCFYAKTVRWGPIRPLRSRLL